MVHAPNLETRVAMALSAVAGAVLPLAFAPFDQFWLAPLSYAVLFYVWHGAAPKRAFWLGLVYGLASFATGTYWTYISVHDYGGAPVVLAAALSLALIATMAVFVGVVGWAAARVFKTAGVAAWLGTLPALWVLAEWCRGWFLTGFGWLSAGYSQTESWLMSFAPLAGLHGMSWALLLSAGALATLVLGTAIERRSALGVLVAIWGTGFALSDYLWTEPKGEVLTVALVQGAVQQDLKWRPEQLAGTLALYRRLTEQSEGSRLIVWPEAAIPTLYEYVGDYLADIKAWADEHDSIVMLGILRGDMQSEVFQNVLVALTEPPSIYVKRHLVPFGEYFPVPGFIRNWMRLMTLPYTDAVPGDADQPPLDLAGERIAVTICYEDVFGAEQLHYLPGATLLVNVSNDAWFGDSIAPHQHLQIAQLRAAEAGRYLLRSTNTGISAVIDPRGRVAARIPQFEPGVLEYAVQGFTRATPYARWGNYPVVLLAFALLLVQLSITKLRIRRGT
jgi:apolipoprotein N-acyltransferase